MRNEWSTPDRKEVVVALQVLAADVNLGYHDWRNWVVDSVNGSPIKNFKQFTDMLEETLKKTSFSKTKMVIKWLSITTGLWKANQIY